MERTHHDPTYLDKLAFLTRLAFTKPKETVDFISRTIERNVDALTRVSASYKPVSLEQCLGTVANTLDGRLEDESRKMQTLEEHIQKKGKALEQSGPFGLSHNGDYALGRLCYMVCRLLQPKIVIETGTAYGVTTSFLLSALHENGQGKLISIDLPPIGNDADRFIGYLIPDYLRSSWQLVRGTSKQHLTPILHEIGHVDLFVHDSAHTYRTMTYEFDTAFSSMSRPGILISDDVGGNSAFAKFTDRTQPQYAGVVREPGKNSFCGVAVFA
jgi:hypothetical protein